MPMLIDALKSRCKAKAHSFVKPGRAQDSKSHYNNDSSVVPEGIVYELRQHSNLSRPTHKN